jgi:hypothetical protein
MNLYQNQTQGLPYIYIEAVGHMLTRYYILPTPQNIRLIKFAMIYLNLTLNMFYKFSRGVATCKLNAMSMVPRLEFIFF